MNRQACSICSTVTGFWPITRRALSPRPIPTSIRPPETSCSVAIALAVTVDVAGGGIGDAGAESDPLGVRGDQRERRVELLPQHVGVPGPDRIETPCFGELRPLDRPRDRGVEHERDAEGKHLVVRLSCGPVASRLQAS